MKTLAADGANGRAQLLLLISQHRSSGGDYECMHEGWNKSPLDLRDKTGRLPKEV